MRVALAGILLVFLCTNVLSVSARAEAEWEAEDCAEMGFTPTPALADLVARFGSGDCERSYQLNGRFANVQGYWQIGDGTEFWMLTYAPYSGIVYLRAGRERAATEDMREWIQGKESTISGTSDLVGHGGGYSFTFLTQQGSPYACFAHVRFVGKKHRGYSGVVKLRYCREGRRDWTPEEVAATLDGMVFKPRYE